jgi:F5/8 type C domain-containing protein
MMVLPASPVDPNNGRIGWHNLVTAANVTASSEAVGFPALNLGNPMTFQVWRASGLAAQTITVNLGASTVVNYIGIARHNLGTAGVNYTIQGSADGDTWTTIAGPVGPSDNGIIFHNFTQGSYAYIRLQLGAGSVAAQLAVLYVGRVLVLERRIYVGHTPINYGRESIVSSGMSESGQFLGRVLRRETNSTKVTLANLTPEWYRSEFEPFAAVAAVTPFFYAWRPQKYPAEVAYAWSTDDPRPSNTRSNGMMQVELTMQGIVR